MADIDIDMTQTFGTASDGRKIATEKRSQSKQPGIQIDPTKVIGTSSDGRRINTAKSGNNKKAR